MEILAVSPEDALLRAVFDLGDLNKATLGLLPRKAIEDHAAKGRLLVAVDDGRQLLGYLLYSVNRGASLVRIVHLCVRPDQRRQGVARDLVAALADRTRGAFSGIRVRCRRDFAQANVAWQRLGFQYGGELPGRSRTGSILTAWKMDFGTPSLLDCIEEDRFEGRLKAVIDANVFYDLHTEPAGPTGPATSLLADWLVGAVELCVTPELANEIHRQADEVRRRSALRAVDGYTLVSCPDDQFQQALRSLRSHFGDTRTDSDESDLRHLAWCLACQTPAFVTQDDALLSRTAQLPPDLDLRVLRPVDFIIQQDELARVGEYRPDRLAATQLGSVRVRASVRADLDAFRAPEEPKAAFRQLLDGCLGAPREVRCCSVGTDVQQLALYAHDRRKPDRLHIPLLRASAERSAAIVLEHLILSAVDEAAKEGRRLTVVSDPWLSPDAKRGLRRYGFVQAGAAWYRRTLSGIIRVERALAELEQAAAGHGAMEGVLPQVCADLQAASRSGFGPSLLRAERGIWPLKLAGVDVPAYVVPIKPAWAVHLFDQALAAGTLEGADVTLMLSVENVYYRAARPRVLSAPARVLWYVSKQSGYDGAMALRALSYLDEVAVGTPKELYPRFRRLGVYEWRHVLQTAKGQPDGQVMAARFSLTELFTRPIPYHELQTIWLGETGHRASLQGPARLPDGLFDRLYRLGMDMP